MNIQTRKLTVINYIVNPTDEPELRRTEVEMLKYRKKGFQENKPFARDEFIARVKVSMEDYR